jgi:regulator of sigma D
MVKQSCNQEELWHNIDAMLKGWLDGRKQTLELYCQLSDHQNPTPEWEEVSEFMQVLLDYVSAGHFEIYDKLVGEARSFKDSNMKLVDILYPKIHETTQVALDFNDKYSGQQHWESQLNEFNFDVTELGKQLAIRAELEDSLIEQLHNSHKPE